MRAYVRTEVVHAFGVRDGTLPALSSQCRHIHSQHSNHGMCAVHRLFVTLPVVLHWTGTTANGSTQVMLRWLKHSDSETTSCLTCTSATVRALPAVVVLASLGLVAMTATVSLRDGRFGVACPPLCGPPQLFHWRIRRDMMLCLLLAHCVHYFLGCLCLCVGLCVCAWVRACPGGGVELAEGLFASHSNLTMGAVNAEVNANMCNVERMLTEANDVNDWLMCVRRVREQKRPSDDPPGNEPMLEWVLRLLAGAGAFRSARMSFLARDRVVWARTVGSHDLGLGALRD